MFHLHSDEMEWHTLGFFFSLWGVYAVSLPEIQGRPVLPSAGRFQDKPTAALGSHLLGRRQEALLSQVSL